MADPDNASETASSPLLVRYRAGDVIYEEGHPGTEMYLVDEGQVELVKKLLPAERRLALYEVGDFFGEMSVLEGSPRRATARAVSDCRLLPIDASTFDRMLREYPEITVRMMRKLSRRLADYEDEYQRAMEIAAGPLRGAPQRDGPDMQPVTVTPPEPVESPSVSRATLVHPATGAVFPVSLDGDNVIGRYDPVTGASPGIDLSEVDGRRSLSRRHARVSCRDGSFYVREEVGSANGTYVRGARLAPGQECEIHDGDSLKLGLVELVFRSAAGD